MHVLTHARLYSHKYIKTHWKVGAVNNTYTKYRIHALAWYSDVTWSSIISTVTLNTYMATHVHIHFNTEWRSSDTYITCSPPSTPTHSHTHTHTHTHMFTHTWMSTNKKHKYTHDTRMWLLIRTQHCTVNVGVSSIIFTTSIISVPTACLWHGVWRRAYPS